LDEAGLKSLEPWAKQKLALNNVNIARVRIMHLRSPERFTTPLPAELEATESYTSGRALIKRFFSLFYAPYPLYSRVVPIS
jgi:hypothetical protein